jgi:hypothetical protein
VVAMFVNGSGQKLAIFVEDYQISVHLGKGFQRRRFFRNDPLTNMATTGHSCF